MDKELVETIVKRYKLDRIIYKGFKDFIDELKIELVKHDIFKNVSPRVLEELITIDKGNGKILTYNIKIMNDEFQFNEMEAKCSIQHIININEVTEANAKSFAEEYIKFCTGKSIRSVL